MKECSKCGRVKPLTAFYKRKDSNDGLRSQCKECSNAYIKARKKPIISVEGDMSLEEIGTKLNLTRQRVSQIEQDALYKISKIAKLMGIEEDLRDYLGVVSHTSGRNY